MDKIATQVKPKWPIVIGILSALHGLARSLMFLTSTNPITLIHIWHSTIILGMFVGAFGLITHKEWGRKVLVLSSWVAAFQGLYLSKISLTGMRGFPPLSDIFGIIAAILIFMGWPVFLIIWFWKHDLITSTSSVQSEDTLKVNEL